MQRWIERAEQELCDAVNSGEMTEHEFNAEMRELMREAEAAADEAAEEARHGYLGY